MFLYLRRAKDLARLRYRNIPSVALAATKLSEIDDFDFDFYPSHHRMQALPVVTVVCSLIFRRPNISLHFISVIAFHIPITTYGIVVANINIKSVIGNYSYTIVTGEGKGGGERIETTTPVPVITLPSYYSFFLHCFFFSIPITFSTCHKQSRPQHHPCFSCHFPPTVLSFLASVFLYTIIIDTVNTSTAVLSRLLS